MIPVEGALVVAQLLAHRTTDREVPSSFPTGSLAFFSSLLFSISLNKWRILEGHEGATRRIL